MKNYVPSSWIIDILPKPTQSLGVAYFFFDGRDGQAELQVHSKLIRSLINQLTVPLHGGIPENLKELHRVECQEGVYQPSDEQLQDILHHILDGLSDVYIVIDALDECTDRQKTLPWVKKLVTQKVGKRLHIVVTSRPERDIEEVFGALDEHSVNVSETTANEDIVKYLKEQMGRQFQKFDKITRNTIEDRLRKHAEGS